MEIVQSLISSLFLLEKKWFDLFSVKLVEFTSLLVRAHIPFTSSSWKFKLFPKLYLSYVMFCLF